MMRKLVLFGDSNTYGYDPRDFFGGRYNEEYRWASIVSKALKDQFLVLEEGQNGRVLPSIQSRFFQELVFGIESGDVLIMMLGTNDILLSSKPNVDATLKKLDAILSYVKENCKGEFFLIAPPYISDMYPDLKPYHECCIKLNQGYMELANKYHIKAVDAALWEIPMAADGVHFSMEGHVRFSEHILEIINFSK